MKRPPHYVKLVIRHIHDWQRGAARFRREAIRGIERDSANVEHVVYRHLDIYGREQITPEVSIRYFRARLAGLLREARRRYRAADWDWFYWLCEYGSLISWELRSDFEEVYSPQLDVYRRTVAQRRAAGKKAAAARQKIGHRKREQVQANPHIVSARHLRRLKSKTSKT